MKQLKQAGNEINKRYTLIKKSVFIPSSSFGQAKETEKDSEIYKQILFV